MLFLEILATVLIAVAVGILFYYIFKTSGPWGTFWSFLLILILAGLAAEAWITPFGPVFWDVAWIPTLFVILLFAILLAAAAPRRRDRGYERRRTEPGIQERNEDRSVMVMGGFFWLFIVFLVIAAIFGLFR